MNGRISKAIRRKVYGDQSTKANTVKYITSYSGTVSVGLRSVYKEAKKHFKEWVRNGKNKRAGFTDGERVLSNNKP